MNGVVLLIVAGVVLIASNFQQKTQVILMPDSDGHVGQVEVISDGGSQVLSAAGQMTVVKGRSASPTAVSVVDQKKVASMFSAALAVEPHPPVKFLLYFLPDSDQLTEESLELMPQVIAAIDERKSSDVGIYGHTDRLGSDTYNQTLSMQRALAVQAILVNQGVRPDDTETASHGEGNPLIATPDGVAEPRNRRVEVIIR